MSTCCENRFKAKVVLPLPPSREYTRIAAYLALFSGSFVLVGWYFDLPALRSLIPQFAPMPPNTALCFIIIGAALLSVYQRRVAWTRAFSLPVLLISVLTFSEVVFAIDLGIDNLLIPLTHAAYPLVERMSGITALNMMGVSITLIMGWEREAWLPRILIYGVAVTSGLALLGFVYNVESLYSLFIYENIAFSTAAVCVLLAGLYFLSQPSAFLSMLMSQTSAGFTGRRLIPLAAVAPVLLGWLMLQLSNRGALDRVLGLVLLVMLTSTVFILVISLTMHAQYAEEMTRREAEKNALELALQRERNRLLNNFVSSTLHDIRTPLTSISTNAYLANRIENEAKRKERLDNIQAQVKHMGGILDQFAEMVRLNRIEEIHVLPININGLLHSLMDEQKHYADRLGISMDAQLMTTIPLVPAAESLLHTALLQVIRNALHYTPSGGKVVLRSLYKDRVVLIEIADTGVGIPPEALTRVFEAQYKVNEARTVDGSWGGFGLSMVKRIMELHGGRAEIESTLGAGTTVRLSFPIQPA